ncbi:MAG TPA: T9SS type A sorting domain-containing protein [Bacteroidia bacterium]|nr:T9SS type A sorting domain-containing protein [Bacteroidia bacterium]
MKKLLLPFFLFSATAVSAQITVTTNDVGPIYNQFYNAVDTVPPNISPGTPGPSQTWNYSTLTSEYTDTLTFTLPWFTSYGSSFPSSNTSVATRSMGTDSWTYLTNTSSSLQINGEAADPLGTGTMAIPFSDPEKMLDFSSTYGSAYTDTAKAYTQFYYGQDPGIGQTVDSVRVHIWVKKTSDIDAWGSLTDPTSTYDVLRQNVLRVEYDTIDAYIQLFGGWIPDAIDQMDSNRVYTFWANAVGYPVVQLTDHQDLDSITKTEYLLGSAMVGMGEQMRNEHMYAFPNPANDNITFNTQGAGAATIVIYNSTGQLVQSMNVLSDKTVLNVSGYDAGVYFYQAKDASGNTLSNGKFAVTH